MKNIVLIGFKSCGKSTIAKNLAKQTGQKILDIDKIIEKGQGKCREIFRKDPKRFREIEKDVLGLVEELLKRRMLAGAK